MSKDAISRQAAIDAVFGRSHDIIKQRLKNLPAAQPERLTDDDFETIRIHLNAYKGKLCNLGRWEEAEEYQRIIDRFMAFASAQPEIIQCKDCKWWREDHTCREHSLVSPMLASDFCSKAERREE